MCLAKGYIVNALPNGSNNEGWAPKLKKDRGKSFLENKDGVLI